MQIEILEARIAPAVLTGNVLTYTDIDGDHVTVKFTGETPVPGDILFASGNFADTTPQSLLSVSLTKTGAGLTLAATPQHGQGDGHANVTLIQADDLDLGVINVDGDVCALDAGSGTTGIPAVKSFTALSMGRNNFHASVCSFSGAGSINIKGDIVNDTVTITGPVKSISIGGNIQETIAGAKAGVIVQQGSVGTFHIGGSVLGLSGGDVNVAVEGGNIGTFSIGGSVRGGSADITSEGTQIDLSGNCTNFSIGGDLFGGAGKRGGTVTVGEHVGTFKIGGSVMAGTGVDTGTIDINSDEAPGTLTAFTIAGNLDSRGGDGGTVFVQGAVGAAKIGGSILGGDLSETGTFGVAGSASSITIGHSVVGGNSTGSDAINDTGGVSCSGHLGLLKIGGDLITGSVIDNGTLKGSGFISSRDTISKIQIGGSIVGSAQELASISADAEGTTGAIAAINSLTVKGSIQCASIVAGYQYNGAVFQKGNTDSGIGSVSVGGDLAGSFIIVGSNTGVDGIPGTTDDQVISTVATIGSVKVGGDFRGLEGDATHYFIYGPIVKKVTVGKVSYTEAALKNSVFFEATGTAIAESIY